LYGITVFKDFAGDGSYGYGFCPLILHGVFMPVVYSTSTNDTSYVQYYPAAKGEATARVKRRVTIRGGANLAPTRKQSEQLITPTVGVTRVTQDELDFLESNYHFNLHKENKFIFVDKSPSAGKREADQVMRSAGMNPRDGSAPLTPNSPECSGLKPTVQLTEENKERLR
jgi:hypothetical protein